MISRFFKRKQPAAPDFRDLVNSGHYFDRTALISDIEFGVDHASLRSSATLIQADPQTGKSTLMSMLKYFYSNAGSYRDLFEGTAVSKHPEVMGKLGLNPVIYCSFDDAKPKTANDVYSIMLKKMQSLYKEFSWLTQEMDLLGSTSYHLFMEIDAKHSNPGSSSFKPLLESSLARLTSYLEQASSHKPIILFDGIENLFSYKKNEMDNSEDFDDAERFIFRFTTATLKDNPNYQFAIVMADPSCERVLADNLTIYRPEGYFSKYLEATQQEYEQQIESEFARSLKI